MPADGGLCEAEPLGELGHGGRAVIQDGARDPVARGALPGREFLRWSRGSLTDVFHNAIVA
ncbi:hypothetical protein GCM10010273_01370 [Streptomyces lavendulocolor]